MKPSILRNGRLVYGPILLLLAVLGLCVFLGTVPAHGDGGPTCNDSDGGLTYDVAGHVEGVGATGYSYWRDDTCLADDLGGYVKEWYCGGTTALPKSYACPYGCDAGACLGLPTGCTDADGDGYALEGGDCGPVDCDDADPAVHPGTAEVCDNGLDDNCNGLADAADPGCTPCVDSDGGLDYEVAGYVAGTGPNGGLYRQDDVCLDGNLAGYVKEYYCSGDTPLPQAHACPYGCDGGACLGLPASCTDADGDGYAVEGGDCGPIDCDDARPAVHPGAAEACDNGLDDDCNELADADDPACTPCVDSDGGLDYEVAGYVAGTGPNGALYRQDDVCLDGNLAGYVKEYYCNDDAPLPQAHACPYGCDGGACLRVPPGCTDADGDGYAPEGGDCGPVDCDDADPAVHPGTAEVCDNGLDDDCNGLADVADPACNPCTDSDGGLGYYMPGTVVDLDGVSYVDTCTTTPHELVEYRCDTQGHAQPVTYTCPITCTAGACGGPNVIVIGWDGTQRDHFWECYDGALAECPDGLPHVAALSGGVVWGSTTTNGGTATKPGWVQILSGYNAEVTGVWDNDIYQPLPEGYSLFEKIENHLGADDVVTMFISGKSVNSGAACVGEETYDLGQIVIEDKGQPWCLTRQHLDYYENDLRFNAAVGSRALELLQAHQHDLFLAFFLFRDPDVQGHIAGENSSYYSNSLVDVDAWLGQIMARLQDLGIDDRTLVYVTTDHGFDEGLRRHNNARFGFLASNDPLIVRSGDRKDLAATILDIYGVGPGPVGPAPAVDGFSLYSLPPLACVPEGGAYLDYPGAPPCCAGLQWIPFDLKLGMQCIPATGGGGENSGYCTDCGNGACEPPEDRCNCPADCVY